MSGSGRMTTKPVPAPRRGRKPKEPSASDKLQNVRLLFQNTVRQFYEWMDKLGKCVCCAYQKRRNVTKVGRPTEKLTFHCPRGRRIFLHKSYVCSPCGTKVRNCPGKLHGSLRKHPFLLALPRSSSLRTFRASSATKSEEERMFSQANCTAMLSQIREGLNTPTDNEQLSRLKRMSKSPHSSPRLRDLALQITTCKNLKSC